jgi:4-hydroxy-tetrahydrodipicolinate synthase
MAEGNELTPPALRGALAPVVTPFREDMSVDADRLARHCRWLVERDCGLAVFGTNSEGNSLGVDEKLGLLDALVTAGLPPARMMPGTGQCAIPDTIRLTRHAVGLGCAGVLMLPPFYYKDVSDEGLFRAIAQVIEGVGDDRLRVYLYHIPPVAQVGFSLDLIARLIEAFPRIVAGIKDSSGDFSNIRAMLERFPGWSVFCGAELDLAEAMRLGAAGCISATCNVNAAAIADLAANWHAPDAAVRQAAVNRVRTTIAGFPMIPALKAVVAELHGDPAWRMLRPPLLPLDAGQRTALAARLDAIGFDIRANRAH